MDPLLLSEIDVRINFWTQCDYNLELPGFYIPREGVLLMETIMELQLTPKLEIWKNVILFFFQILCKNITSIRSQKFPQLIIVEDIHYRHWFWGEGKN